MSKIGWFEILSEGDNEALANFYKDIFGWQFEKQDTGYEYYMLKNDDEVGIGGGIMERKLLDNAPASVAAFVNTVMVESVDDKISQIEQAGGRLLAPKHAIPGMGWHAYLADPAGNIFGIMDNKKTAGQ